jgi:hypothetical protein
MSPRIGKTQPIVRIDREKEIWGGTEIAKGMEIEKKECAEE